MPDNCPTCGQRVHAQRKTRPICARETCTNSVSTMRNRYCSPSCRGTAKREREPYPTCALAGCGRTVKRRTKKFCSFDCSVAVRAQRLRPPPPEKTCARPECGKVFVKRRKQGKAQWEAQDFCSVDCRYPDRGKAKAGKSKVARPRKPATAAVKPAPPVLPPPPPAPPREVWRPAGLGRDVRPTVST